MRKSCSSEKLPSKILLYQILLRIYLTFFSYKVCLLVEYLRLYVACYTRLIECLLPAILFKVVQIYLTPHIIKQNYRSHETWI